MRFWILALLLNVLFQGVMRFAAPVDVDALWYYVGSAVCALIALAITWNDESGVLEKILASLIKWGIAGFGAVFFLWGAGVKLGLWSRCITGEPGKLTSLSDNMLPTVAILLGPLVLIVIFINLRSRWL